MIKTLLTLTILCSSFFAISQTTKLNSFIKETQINSSTPNEMVIGWWIPVEFWSIAFENEATMTDAQKDEFIESFKGYAMFCILKGEINTLGNSDFLDYETIANNLKAVSQTGKTYKILKEEELPVTMQMMLSMFKPMFKKMMGDMGENLHFYVFSDDNKGKRNFDPFAKGEISVYNDYVDFTWETPIPSLLDEKTCSEGDKTFPGTFIYCPYHGVLLK